MSISCLRLVLDIAYYSFTVDGTIHIYTSWRSALSMHLVWTIACFHNKCSPEHSMYLAHYGSWKNMGLGFNCLLLNDCNNNYLLTVSVTVWKPRLWLCSYCVISGWTWLVKQVLMQRRCIYRLLLHVLRAATQANRVLRLVTLTIRKISNGMK